MIERSNIAARLLADEPALLTSLDFGPFVRQGTGSGPSLLIGDVSEINLMRPGRTSRLDHRMAHLAHAGDVVLVRERDPVFEGYLQEFCTLKDIEFFGTDPTCDDGVAKQALTSAPLFDHLVDVTRKNGGLTIQPYLTTETIWHLAKAIGERANCIVNVSGPSSRISLRANDKLWFVQLARTVIGNDAVPPTISAYGPMASAALIQWFSTQGKQVIVKVPDSAGSAGNIRLDPEILENLSTDEIEALLIERLHGTGWADTYPILVGVWDSNVSCTPSVQMWVPHISEGLPTVQGVFEQRVFGPTAAFVGAIKSRQPATLQHALADQALAIARVLQRLGYYGRCSLDAVICDHDNVGNSIHWIECNARWSGVSIPLAILDSIGVKSDESEMMILQERLPGGPIDTPSALKAMGDVLYSGAPSKEGVILMSPPMGAVSSTANLLVFAKFASDIEQIGNEAMQRLKLASM